MAGRNPKQSLAPKKRTDARITERRLVDVLVQHIRRSHRVTRELSVYERHIDVAALCPTTGELWSIEAKISNWTRAIGQAVVNLAASEKSFIAIYSKNVHCVQDELLVRYGIGLISVGTKWEDVKIVREAKPSQFVNKLVLDRLKTKMRI